jgi:hypothetical protein
LAAETVCSELASAAYFRVTLGIGLGDFCAPPVTRKAPTRAMNSGEVAGAVGLAWLVMYQHGNKNSG